MRALFTLTLLLAGGAAWGQSAGERLAKDISETRPGRTFRVPAGDFGLVVLKGQKFPSSIHVDASAARLSGLVLDGVEGLEWHGGSISAPGGKSYGVTIRRAKGVAIHNMTIRGAHRGIVVDSSERVSLVENQLTDLVSDGIDIALSHFVTIKGNTCSNFQPRAAVYAADGSRLQDGDHPDCIQAWSRPTASPTSDIQVIENTALGRMQGIFFGNHIRGGLDDGGFDRIVIRGNHILISLPNGIAISGGRDVSVTGNDVGTVKGAVLPNKPIAVKAVIRASGSGVVACDNRVSALPSGFGTSPCSK